MKTVAALPVRGGHGSEHATQREKTVQGNGSPVVPVVAQFLSETVFVERECSGMPGMCSACREESSE